MRKIIAGLGSGFVGFFEPVHMAICRGAYVGRMSDSRQKWLVLDAPSSMTALLVEQLAQCGGQVVVGVPSPVSPGYGLDCVLVDYTDVVSMASAMRSMDVLVIPPFQSPDARARHALVLEAAEQAQVSHVIRLSCIGADPRSQNDWLRLNGQADNRLRMSSLNYTVFECAPLMQTIQLQVQTHQAGVQRLQMPLGQGAVCWLDLADLAACIAERAAQVLPEGMTYQLTGRQRLRGDQLAQAMADALGCMVVYLDAPEHAWLAGLASRGVSPQEVMWEKAYFRAIRAGVFELPYGDIYRLLLTPPRTLSVYLARTQTQHLFENARP